MSNEQTQITPRPLGRHILVSPGSRHVPYFGFTRGRPFKLLLLFDSSGNCWEYHLDLFSSPLYDSRSPMAAPSRLRCMRLALCMSHPAIMTDTQNMRLAEQHTHSLCTVVQ